MNITLGWFSLPVSNPGSLVWDLRTKKMVKILNWETTQTLHQKWTWSQSPKKGSISKGIFMGYFVSFFGGMTASKRLQPTWACPPKELPFLRRQPWWRRGKGFRHGGRSNRQGHDRWLLQRRDGKHLGRRTLGKKKGKKKNRNCLWWFLAFFFGWELKYLAIPECFAKGPVWSKPFRWVISWTFFVSYGCKNEYPTNGLLTLPRFRAKEVSSKNVLNPAPGSGTFGIIPHTQHFYCSVGAFSPNS